MSPFAFSELVTINFFTSSLYAVFILVLIFFALSLISLCIFLSVGHLLKSGLVMLQYAKSQEVKEFEAFSYSSMSSKTAS